jgi:hypothetical protein
MKIFECQSCGNTLHFDNTTCIECGHRLGYLPDAFLISAVEPIGDQWRALADPTRSYFFCSNATDGACNWLIPASTGDGSPAPALCACCKHNRLVPDLTDPKHFAAWLALEHAKHHLFYSLMRWKLPIPDRTEDPEGGLAFEFLADVAKSDGKVDHVMTGHDNGIITLNIAEADDSEREKLRVEMGEPYRTLLGHFRHEIGHYYWDRLVRDSKSIDRCRALFGDDREDYGEALKRHYEQGAPANWQEHYISSYASTHPWEDFAETWAHYMHMVDALETAYAFGLVIRPKAKQGKPLETTVGFDPYTSGSIDELLKSWVPVTVALNSLNRSMGQPDMYPFVLPEAVTAKLAFIHDVVRGAKATQQQRAA